MFSSTRNHGFQMKFENGWTISVQWSKNNYCERRTFDVDFACLPEEGDVEVESPDAEVAAWYGERNRDKPCEGWLDIYESDQVAGWLSADEVATWITKVAAFKGNHKLESERLRLDERITEWNKSAY